jgi:hypothetical protein
MRLSAAKVTRRAKPTLDRVRVPVNTCLLVPSISVYEPMLPPMVPVPVPLFVLPRPRGIDVGQLAVVLLALTYQVRFVCGAVAVTVNRKRVMVAGLPTWTILSGVKSLPGVVLARSAAVTSMGMAAGMVWTATVIAAGSNEESEEERIRKAKRFIIVLGKGAGKGKEGGGAVPPSFLGTLPWPRW